MLVKLVQNQAHTVHQAVHIRRFPFRILRPAVSGKGSLELFEIPHPLHRKRVGLHVRLVENEDKRQLGFVEYATRVEHVGHECCGGRRSRCVDDVGHHGWEGRCEGIGDDGSRRGPSEDLNLPRSIQNDITGRI